MVYVPLLTGSGPRLMVGPKRNRAIFRSLIEAQLAESRFIFNERRISYQKYRSLRGRAGTLAIPISITKTVKEQDKLDALTFSRFDSGVLTLTTRPRRPVQSQNIIAGFRDSFDE
jgi:hypothetical protein